MILVANASVLVAELLRERGRVLVARADLRIVVAEDQWDEAQHELARRLAIIVEQGRLTANSAQALRASIQDLIDVRAIEVIPRAFYAHLESVALRRVPRDPNDWAPVALALALGAGILTGDQDFLGCGCPTWTVETLRAELDQQ